MTEKEAIIQALRSCARRNCGECLYRGKGIGCKYILMADAAECLENAAYVEQTKEEKEA